MADATTAGTGTPRDDSSEAGGPTWAWWARELLFAAYLLSVLGGLPHAPGRSRPLAYIAGTALWLALACLLPLPREGSRPTPIPHRWLRIGGVLTYIAYAIYTALASSPPRGSAAFVFWTRVMLPLALAMLPAMVYEGILKRRQKRATPPPSGDPLPAKGP